MENYKLKIITGFNDEQKLTINAEEAHKAYYLFNHPEERGTFKNGTAIIGKYIQTILPDYHATMGWNKSHELDDDDWNEIRSKKIDRKINDLLEKAKKVVELIEKEPITNLKFLLDKKLSEFLPQIEEQKQPEIKKISDNLVDKFKIK